MAQDVANGPDAQAMPRGRMLLFFAQIVAFEIIIAMIGIASRPPSFEAQICFGIVFGEIAFLTSLLTCSTFGPWIRFGLPATLPIGLCLLDDKIPEGLMNPALFLTIVLTVMALIPLRFAGLRITTDSRGAIAAGTSSAQFKLSQLLGAITFCAVVMGYLRSLPTDVRLVEGVISFLIPLAAGGLVATWTVFGRGAAAWRIATLGLALLGIVATSRWFAEYMLGRWRDQFSTLLIVQILFATALLGFARWCGFRARWIGRATLDAPPSTENAPDTALDLPNSGEAPQH
jgi:hypothetical protein